MSIRRRHFLQGAGVAGTAATLSGGFLFDKLFVRAQAQAQPAPAAGDQLAFTGCFTCLGRCTLQVQIAPGDIPRYVTGDIEGPVNEGAVCALGAGSPFHYLSPARLRYPLLRKPDAARGEGKFVRVGWQDMLDILVLGDEAAFLKQRGWKYGFLGMKAIREKFPERLAYYTGRDQVQPHPERILRGCVRDSQPGGAWRVLLRQRGRGRLLCCRRNLVGGRTCRPARLQTGHPGRRGPGSLPQRDAAAADQAAQPGRAVRLHCT